MARPVIVRTAERFRTVWRMFLGVAPRATRMPSSRVQRATE